MQHMNMALSNAMVINRCNIIQNKNQGMLGFWSKSFQDSSSYYDFILFSVS